MIQGGNFWPSTHTDKRLSILEMGAWDLRKRDKPVLARRVQNLQIAPKRKWETQHACFGRRVQRRNLESRLRRM